MVVFFQKGANLVIAVETTHRPDATEAEKLSWLFGGATLLVATSLKGRFIGPRRGNDYPVGAQMQWKSPRIWGLRGITPN